MSDAILVMNTFPGLERAPENALHYKAVLCNHLAFVLDAYVTKRVNMPVRQGIFASAMLNPMTLAPCYLIRLPFATTSLIRSRYNCGLAIKNAT